VFNAPRDQIIWDVGHQAYGHKILTGRRDVFHTNRKYGGISGFPKPSESVYDAFGVGHSSTSISAALGLAAGNDYQNQSDRQVVAIIGDGALSGGMAMEALNNAGDAKKNLLLLHIINPGLHFTVLNRELFVLSHQMIPILLQAIGFTGKLGEFTGGNA